MLLNQVVLIWYVHVGFICIGASIKYQGGVISVKA